MSKRTRLPTCLSASEPGDCWASAQCPVLGPAARFGSGSGDCFRFTERLNKGDKQRKPSTLHVRRNEHNTKDSVARKQTGRVGFHPKCKGISMCAVPAVKKMYFHALNVPKAFGRDSCFFLGYVCSNGLRVKNFVLLILL
ncbi:hypothetical protein ElyMa_000889400 [Elysia marginata]|uniref:Uncharacterized protein n=1 Tax=Elysia marginata TaxID=1093978 RepID=A0AAV4H8B6_9GAST|nr:hypothetical protein ElyMa_000889400 [Elysia marginata]